MMKDRNENRPGYKSTKVGWIPKEWDERPFRNLCVTGPQNGLYKNQDAYGEGCRMVHMPHLFANNYISDQEMPHVHLTESEKKNYLLKNGDLLFARRSLAVEGAGKCVIVQHPSEPLTFESSIIRITPNIETLDYRYAYFFIASPYGRYQMYTFTRVVAVSGIAGSDLKLYRLTVPPLSEQKKIAGILTTWDEAIEQAQKIIEAKKLRKKALVQQLLTGKRLFLSHGYDYWNLKLLGDLIEPVSRPVPKPQNPYLSIGIRSHGKGTFQKTVEKPEKVMMDTLYRVKANDLIVNITFAWEGAIAITSDLDSGGLVSHRFPTYRLKETEADLDFFRNLIITKRFVWDLGLISPGGAGRNRVLNQKDFLKLKVSVPSIKKQREIGEILTSADNELHVWEEYLSALEKQKRGLMQKLLTGEVRVKL